MLDSIRKSIEQQLRNSKDGKIIDLTNEVLTISDYEWLTKIIQEASFLEELILPEISQNQLKKVISMLDAATVNNSTLTKIQIGHLHHLSDRIQSRLDRNKKNVFAIHGGGNIGLGLMGHVIELADRDYQIIATSSNEKLREIVNSKNQVCIQHTEGNETSYTYINNVTLISRKPEDITKLYADACIAAICVTPVAMNDIANDIAEALISRYETDGSGLKILVLMNIPHCNDFVYEKIFSAMLAITNNEDYVNRVLRGIELIPTVIDRIVKPISVENLDEHQAIFNAEKLFSMYVPKSFTEAYRFPAMKRTSDLSQIEAIKNKFINGPHVILAWLGALRGYKTISECIRDLSLRQFIYKMMNLEIKPILMAEYPDLTEEELDEFKNSFIERCINSQEDPVTRVGRDPLRKLDKCDRIRGTMELAAKHKLNIPTPGIEYGIAAGLLYSAKDIDPENPGCKQIRDIFTKHKNFTSVLCYSGKAPSGHFSGFDIKKDKSKVNSILSKLSRLKSWSTPNHPINLSDAPSESMSASRFLFTPNMVNKPENLQPTIQPSLRRSSLC